MKFDLEAPTWYSRESMYASQVKSTDLTLTGPCVNFGNAGNNLAPSADDVNAIKEVIINALIRETGSWFSTPLNFQQVLKRFSCEFPKFEYAATEKWGQAIWVPHYFQVKKSGFVLLFKVQSVVACNPRIPITFFESMTPRATTPTEEATREEVRNIVLHPGAGPSDLEQIDDIPLSEGQASFEIRDEKTRELHKLRQAKLRAAIARLKVEEMRERYLRHYGDEYGGDSSDSEEEDSSIQSEFSEPVPKK
jgi:hypothetical protein